MHELFFSATDRKGIIRSGNDVFVRVSGHPVERLIGAPHNVIRHPDMPRAVFRLMWDYLQRGAAFAGFVKNMAADGAYYWVMALAVPIDDGYLSVRLKPSSPYFESIRGLYAELLGIERAAGASAEARRAGMEASTARLLAAVRELGFADYDEFMRVALAAELHAHQAAVRARRETHGRGAAAAASHDLAQCRRVERCLDELFSRVEGLLAVIKKLEAAARFVQGMAADIHLISLNALVGACRLDRGGAGLSVVTEDLARLSQDCTDNVTGMTGQLGPLAVSLGEVAFATTAARLQAEMMGFFIDELGASGDMAAGRDAARTRSDLHTLSRALSATTDRLASAAPRARAPLAPLSRLQQQLESDLRRLSSVHLIGAIQAVAIVEAAMFRELLDRIVEQLGRSEQELQVLTDGVSSLRDHLPVFERTANEARQAAHDLAGHDLAA